MAAAKSRSAQAKDGSQMATVQKTIARMASPASSSAAEPHTRTFFGLAISSRGSHKEAVGSGANRLLIRTRTPDAATVTALGTQASCRPVGANRSRDGSRPSSSFSKRKRRVLLPRPRSARDDDHRPFFIAASFQGQSTLSRIVQDVWRQVRRACLQRKRFSKNRPHRLDVVRKVEHHHALR